MRKIAASFFFLNQFWKRRIENDFFEWIKMSSWPFPSRCRLSAGCQQLQTCFSGSRRPFPELSRSNNLKCFGLKFKIIKNEILSLKNCFKPKEAFDGFSFILFQSSWNDKVKKIFVEIFFKRHKNEDRNEPFAWIRTQVTAPCEPTVLAVRSEYYHWTTRSFISTNSVILMAIDLFFLIRTNNFLLRGRNLQLKELYLRSYCFKLSSHFASLTF